jgi:outer membrane protein assembly factor BamB
VVADGKVVFGSDDGIVYIVSLQDGKQLWSYEIGQAVGSSPAVADEKIVIGSDDGSVYCFGRKS